MNAKKSSKRNAVEIKLTILTYILDNVHHNVLNGMAGQMNFLRNEQNSNHIQNTTKQTCGIK